VREYNPDGRKALSGSLDGTLRLWDLNTAECIRIFESHFRQVTDVSMTPDGRLAVSCAGLNAPLLVWDLKTGGCIPVFWNSQTRLQAKEATATEMVYSLETSEAVHVAGAEAHGPMRVSITPDGRRVVSGSFDHSLRIWDLEKGLTFAIDSAHDGPVRSVSIAPDGRWAMTAGDKTVRLWDLDSRTCLRVLEGHTFAVEAVAFTPDGSWAISGSLDKTLKVWDLGKSVCLRTILGHSHGVASLSIMPDGRRAVSGGDNSLKVWNLENGEPLSPPKAHWTIIYSIATG
jgi:WD40 repeat protein